jgi:glutaredoxin 3
MFVFFDNRAELRTVERIAQVELTARAAVQVLDPRHRLNGDRVIVADLRQQKSPKGYRSWITTRGKWLAQTMPKYSRLKAPLKPIAHPDSSAGKADTQAASKNASKRAARRRLARLRRLRKLRAKRAAARAAAAAKVTAAKAAAAKAAKAPKRPPVLLFSTSWCPSCKRAKAYFLRRKVRFAEFDVERDPRAARHFLLIQKRAGLRPGVVPLIMVGQRAFQGFSEQRMEEVLLRYGVLKPAGAQPASGQKP